MGIKASYDPSAVFVRLPFQVHVCSSLTGPRNHPKGRGPVLFLFPSPLPVPPMRAAAWLAIALWAPLFPGLGATIEVHTVQYDETNADVSRCRGAQKPPIIPEVLFFC